MYLLYIFFLFFSLKTCSRYNIAVLERGVCGGVAAAGWRQRGGGSGVAARYEVTVPSDM